MNFLRCGLFVCMLYFYACWIKPTALVFQETQEKRKETLRNIKQDCRYLFFQGQLTIKCIYLNSHQTYNAVTSVTCNTDVNSVTSVTSVNCVNSVTSADGFLTGRALTNQSLTLWLMSSKSGIGRESNKCLKIECCIFL